MEYKERISRNQRRRWRLPWVGIAAVLIILCLAAITLYRFQFHKYHRPAQTYTPSSVPPPDFRTTAEALVVRCCRSFGLSDSAYIDSTINQPSGTVYHRFRQGWPSELPFLLFARRLSEQVKQRNFQCDCKESSKQGWLDCSIKSGNIIGARVLLDAGRKTNLADREVAIILDDLGAFKGEEIVKIIRSGVVFSYIGKPDYYPTGDMVKLFARGNISSIVSLPRADYRAGNSPSFRKPIVKNALSRHPGARSFIFDGNAPGDSRFMKGIIDEARLSRLPYLYYQRNPQPVDQFAISAGVPIVRLEFMTDEGGSLEHGDRGIKGDVPEDFSTAARYRLELFNTLLAADGPHHFAVCFDANGISPEWLISVKETLSGLGVKLRPYMKLAQEVKSL